MKVSILADNIDLNNKNKEYNSVEGFIKSDKSNIFNLLDSKKLFKDTASVLVFQAKVKNINIFDKLYQLYVECKLTKVVRRNKSIIAMKNKLKEIYPNF